MFIAGLKEVLEASLGTQEILDGKFVFGFVAQDPFAVIHFEEGPVAGLHCQAADLHDFAGLIAPAAGAGRHHIEESRPFGIDCFRRLAVQIFEVLCERGLGRIRHMVLGDNGGQVLAVLDLAVRTFAGGRRRRVRKHRSRRRTLNAGVHVGTIIIAHIDHIVSAFHGAGQRLEADIIGSAVSAEGDEFKILIFRQPPSLAEGFIGGLHAAQGRARVLEGVVDIAVLPGGIGVHVGGDLKAARGVADDSPVSLVQGAQHGADADGGSASGTHPVPGRQALRPPQHGPEAEILLLDCCRCIYIAHSSRRFLKKIIRCAG